MACIRNTGMFTGLASLQAARIGCDVVIDAFAGCGGNTIQLALACNHVRYVGEGRVGRGEFVDVGRGGKL